MAMQCITEKVPVELRERAQWVLWRYETNDKGKPTKEPYQTKYLTSPLREFSQDSCGLSHGCA